MAKPGPKKGEGGRPRKEVAWAQVDKLCQLHAPACEIADYLSVTDWPVSYNTLDRHAMEEHGVTFGEYVRQKTASFGKIKLRQLQWKTAESGNPTMLIWLGKQMLGQTDKVDTRLTGTLDVTETVTVYQLPDNGRA